VKVAVLVALAAAMALGGCGKKGPPLAPLLRLPAQIVDLETRRVDERVHLRFTVPAANVEGDRPADLAWVEVYAVTALRPPVLADAENGDLRTIATLVAREPVRPPLPDDADTAPAPRGLVQGGPALVTETLDTGSRTPVELRGDARDADDAPLPRPAVLPEVHRDLRRYYFAVGLNRRGRPGPPTVLVEAPVGPVSGPPSAPAVAYTATELTVTWTPPADARLAPEPSDGLLPSRPLAPPPPPTRYNVYLAADAEDPGPDATPLNGTPLTEPRFVETQVRFGVEQCFVVRPVDVLAGHDVEGPASPPACETPRDTFPPPAPSALAAVGASGVVSLIWEPVTDDALAGYLVLRGEAGDDGEEATLEALTPQPIRENTYRDTAVRPGVRYVYAVVAVDTSGNRSEPSNRVEETPRE
jgi:hypothetical protein